MQNIFQELKRRNVFRVGIAYVVIAWVVAQVAELALDSFEAPAWVMKTLLLLLSLGAPLVMLIAWAYELTPEGVKREKDVDRSQSITHETGHKLDYITIGALIAAGVFVLADRFVLQDPVQVPEAVPQAVQAQSPAVDGSPAGGAQASSEQQSIAVLPFVDMSPQKDQEYFSDGISEELLNVLVKIKGVKVASRTSSFAFKGKDMGIPEIAQELQVDNVLEGSVRKAGDKVRITAQLIDVRTDRHLWSETYDRKLEDVFAVQDEIAQKIVEALTLTLGAGEKAALVSPHQATENLEAYELFLRGRALWQRRGADNIRKAIGLYNQALDLDPEFPRATSALAAAYLTLSAWDSDSSRDEAVQQAEVFARKALSMDPDIAEALAVMGDVTRVKANWEEAEKYYLRAIALEPGSVTGVLWYAEFLMDVGRVQDALVAAKKAIELDPLSPGARANITDMYIVLGDYDSALEQARIVEDLRATSGSFRMIVANVYAGNYQRAMELAEEFAISEGEPGLKEDIARWIDAERNPEARNVLVEWVQSEDIARFSISELARYGELDLAFSVLPGRRDYGGRGYWFLWRADLAPMRADPRFKSFVTDMGLVDYWRSNTWSDACHPSGDDFTCE